MKEIWKDIKGYEGLYQISNFGRVKSFKGHKPRILKVCIDSKGYNKYMLSLGGNLKTHPVHRLVSEHFIPNPSNKSQVNHKDGDRLNNKVDNLEWVTPPENMQHAHRLGLINYNKGVLCNNKLSEKDVVNIRTALSSLSTKELADILGVHYTTIRNIKLGKSWKHVS